METVSIELECDESSDGNREFNGQRKVKKIKIIEIETRVRNSLKSLKKADEKSLKIVVEIATFLYKVSLWFLGFYFSLIGD